MISLDLPPPLWLPPKPAIIQPASEPLRKAAFPFPAFIPVRKPPTASFRAIYQSSTDASSYSFAASDIGTADSKRHVLVCVVGKANGSAKTITGVTIDGNAMTQLEFQNHQSAGDSYCGWYILAWPTGTTATIAFTSSATVQRAAIAVYAVYNLVSAALKTFAKAGSTTDPKSLNVNVADKDLVFAGGISSSGSGTTTCAWTGVSEEWDATVESSGTCFSGGSYVATAAETPRTVSADFSTTPETASAVAIVLA